MTAARRFALAYSAKTAAAALLALWISLWVGLSMPFWAMTTAYIVSSPMSGATRSKAVYRVGGTVLGAAVAVALVPALVDWPELLSLAIALWLGGCLAVALLDRSPRAYVVMLAGYTAALVAFPAVDRPDAVFSIVVARVTEIVLGIGCSTVVHSLFWPRSVAEAMQPRLRAWLADARQWHGDIVGGSDNARLLTDKRRLAVDAMDCALLATHVPFDTSHWREATATLQALLRRMLLLLPVLSGLADRKAALDGEGDEGRDGATWAMLLRESLAQRDAEARTLLGECDALLAHLADPASPRPDLHDWREGAVRFHAEPAGAILSGASALVATLAACALWIFTGWADGGVAAVLTGIFCCLFAAQDNPVPAILSFGGAIVAGIPIAALYLFFVLPGVDGFAALALLLAIPLVAIGALMTHPRLGLPAMACLVGFCSAMAIQEEYVADFARFLNSNLAQIVAVILAAGTTACFRMAGGDVAIARLNRRMQRGLVDIARAPSAPDPLATLSRVTDQLALIAQRLGGATDAASMGLAEVRLAMNLVSIQRLRASSSGPLRAALDDVLEEAAHWFSAPPSAEGPSRRMLDRLDGALRLTLDNPPPRPGGMEHLFRPGPDQGRPALVALRRSLFSRAEPFSAGASA